MTLQAYQNAQRAVEDPRITEYRLFGQVTGALLDAKSSNANGASLVFAIDVGREQLHPSLQSTDHGLILVAAEVMPCAMAEHGVDLAQVIG